MIRLSALLLRTLRDDPADAEVASHRLLVRAGYVRRVAPGIFSWLPLGVLVLRHVEAIVRQEMDGIAQEVLLPTLLPRQPYETTGRWEEYGPSLFRLRDRRDGDYLLGPTHEEIFATLVRGEVSSYRDLPLSIYQIQTKYRDEVRPRAGILRAREFVMKDSYSFDVDVAGLDASYAAHRDAYERIFERLGLDTVIVSAVSGAMGGSRSEEFLARSEAGEDQLVRCAACGYAANVEAVSLRAAATPAGDAPPPVEIDTPATASIDALITLLADRSDLARADGTPWRAAHTLKNVVVTLTWPDGRREPLAIGIPGDREVDVRRLEAALAPATVEPFTEADLAAHPSLVAGYIGPDILGVGRASGVRYLVDELVGTGSAWISGANRRDHHVMHLVRGRDFEPDGEVGAAEVRAGDPCPGCGGALQIERGIEVGHIFQLGTKYASALDLTVTGPDGRPTTVTMGSYGIGVSRVVGAIAEQHHDERGLLWPGSVAPALVHIVATGKDAAPFAAADDLATVLEQHGLTVLVDDRRSVSAGVKFADAELLGVPVVVIVGKQLANGAVEIRRRADGISDITPVADAPARITELARSA